jgi:glycine C-acetyltransferase
VHGRVDIQVGTLSKAIGALGGYVAGSRDLIDFLYHRARPFLFSTSHPPAVAAACIAALDVLERSRRSWSGSGTTRGSSRQGSRRSGSTRGAARAPSRPVIVGGRGAGDALSDRLFEEGVFAQGIGFPTVARDKARVRTIVTATHTREDLQYALDAFGKVGRELGLI